MMKIKNIIRLSALSCLIAFVIVSSISGDSLIPDLDVPYEPTHPQVVSAMLSLADVSKNDVVYDLGCGDGRIVVDAVMKFSALRGVGIDLDPQRIREADERAEGYGVSSKVKFIHGDILDADISEASVVTMYLLNSVNFMIRPKLFMELSPGTRLVSHAFHMREWDEDRITYHPRARNNTLYYWIIPAELGGRWSWETGEGKSAQKFSLNLRQNFQKITGELEQGGRTLELIKPSVDGKAFRFSVRIMENRKPVLLNYEGTVEGNTINGTVSRENDPSKNSWTAERGDINLRGKWSFSIDRQKRDYEGILDLKKEGRHINASFSLKKDSTVKVVKQIYVWGSSVYFYLPLHGTGNDIIFSGELDGNRGSGTLTNVSWGPSEYKWNAVRLRE